MSSCFLFESKGSVDTVIEVPPSHEKNGSVLYKVKGVGEDMLPVQMVHDIVEFVHFDWFNWQESNLQERVWSFLRVGCRC